MKKKRSASSGGGRRFMMRMGGGTNYFDQSTGIMLSQMDHDGQEIFNR